MTPSPNGNKVGGSSNDDIVAGLREALEFARVHDYDTMDLAITHLEALLDEIERLRAENHALQRELAVQWRDWQEVERLDEIEGHR